MAREAWTDPQERAERVVIEGVEFLATLTVRSDVGLLALHGSREGGTAELAHEVAARTGATCLVFTQPAGDPVHIPSHRMSVPHCESLREFLAHVSLTISLHGHLRRETPRSIFLGGTNREAAHTMAEALAPLAPSFEAVTDMPAIPSGLRGLNPRNPVNLTRSGGVQIELPLTARTARPGRVQGAPDTPPSRVTTALTAGARRVRLPRRSR
ncbi:poly-gamma-glutamate hydrolase family protein [Streptomyces sp. NBC_00820]|uniref:poly-gamma-glutamate hydrolase family protein n=1 Tax=Streptomyces sp. NBC_00820 TaxID=2975842 RepID=UPI002ED3FDE9|nr:poly-gamma-glutamate hydrolase family protein [Streptomyces sp. NBC_00820]